MLKKAVLGALAALTVAVPAIAGDAEINYPKGSLGYSELVSGDNEAAIRSIKSDTNVRHDDPAQMLNLGLAYERMGDLASARQLYGDVLSQTRSAKLVLSNGAVVDSHDLASNGLNRVDTQMAMR